MLLKARDGCFRTNKTCFEYSFLKMYTAAKNVIPNLHVSVFLVGHRKGFLRHKHFPTITFPIFSKLENILICSESRKTEIISFCGNNKNVTNDNSLDIAGKEINFLNEGNVRNLGVLWILSYV